jgi:hypothetical protein
VAQCLAEIILLAHPLHQTVYPYRVSASLQSGPRHELRHILRDLRQLGLLRDHILHRRHPVQDLPALLRVPVGDRNFQHDQRLLHTASTDASDLRYAHAPRQENSDRFDLWTRSIVSTRHTRWIHTTNHTQHLHRERHALRRLAPIRFRTRPDIRCRQSNALDVRESLSDPSNPFFLFTRADSTNAA